MKPYLALLALFFITLSFAADKPNIILMTKAMATAVF